MSLDLPLPDALLPAPTSAARRAAEAAFAPLPRKTDAPPAQVTVRRRRAGPAAPEPATDDRAGAPEEAARSPRVFRVDTPVAPAAADTAAAAPAAAPMPAPRPRSRRRSPDRRPSPVVVVVPPAEEPPAGALDPRLNRLGEALAPVGPVLGEIARAQAFRFDGGAVAGDWQALSQRIEALLEELRQRPR